MNSTYKIEKVLAKNEDLDYSIFNVVGSSSLFSYLIIAYSFPKVGENVFIIGKPQGLEHTLSIGSISALRENNPIIQTTTETTHGSNGGPFFNKEGEVIGFTIACLGEANLYSALNVVRIGLGNYGNNLDQLINFSRKYLTSK